MSNGAQGFKPVWGILLVLLCTSSALADLLPTYQDLLESRVRREPAHYDHADAFCRGKKLGDRCVITGTALEGGGDGLCKRILDGWGNRVIAECERASTPEIDRQIPASPYQLDESVCQMVKASRGEVFREDKTGQQLSCGPVPTVSDRFCAGRKPRDACVAQLSLNSAKIENAGVCKTQKDEAQRFELRINRGSETMSFVRQSISRPLLLCEATKSVNHDVHPARPPGLFRWLDGLW